MIMCLFILFEDLSIIRISVLIKESRKRDVLYLFLIPCQVFYHLTIPCVPSLDLFSVADIIYRRLAVLI